MTDPRSIPFASTLIVALVSVLGASLIAPAAVAQPSESEACALGAAILGRYDGYRIRSYDTNRLQQGYYRDYEVPLSRINDYVIYACGGGRVADLDLHAYDGRGRLITKDTERDALPVVEFDVIRSGTFKIRVDMYDTIGSGYAWYTLVVLYR